MCVIMWMVARVPIRLEVAVTDADVRCCEPLFAGSLSDADAQGLATAFAALADPVRLRILNCIAVQPGGACCGCDLTGPLDRSQPTISHHLKVLADAGLIQGERRGRWVWYSLVPERWEQVREALALSPELAAPAD